MVWRPNFKSIGTRLFLLGIGFVLVSALVHMLLLGSYLRQDITAQTSVQLETLANYVAKDIDHAIVERRDFLTRLAEQLPIALLDQPRQLEVWLAERHPINPLFSHGLAVLDLQGLALADYPVMAGRRGQSFADRDYFQQALKGEFAIGRAVVGRVAKVPVLPMALPLRDRTGSVRAVLVGVSALASTNFITSLQTTRIGVTGGLVLVSPRDKMFIGATDTNIALKPTPKEGEHLQHDQAMKGFRGTGIGVNKIGVEELAAIASVPSSGWFVVARLPTQEAFASIARVRQFIVKTTLVLAVFFLLVLVSALGYLLSPLLNAARHADRMTRGETPFETLPVVRDDEIGRLTAAFNGVLAKLLESRAKLKHIAHHDQLTGLPNRELLADRMRQALARAQRSQGKVAVLFIDLDGFKLINDSLGHDVGDGALCAVTRRLSEIVRREDTLARVGGDEFVVVLCDLNENAKLTAELVAGKCLAAFRQPFAVGDHTCELGASIGITVGQGEDSPEQLLIAADRAMYRAKDAGRRQFAWADDALDWPAAPVSPTPAFTLGHGAASSSNAKASAPTPAPSIP